MPDSTAEQICRRYDKLDGELGNWRSHWEEIAERVLPRYSSHMSGAAAGDAQTRGEKRTEKMFDSTAALGLERFAAAMESMLTPRNQQWHRLAPSDPYLANNRQVKLWFEEATNVLFKHRYAPKANYASQQHEAYIGLGAFGTSAIMTERHEQGAGLRYRALNLRELVFDMSAQGIVDTVYRKYSLKARQVQQRVDSGFFETGPKDLAKDMAENPDKEYKIIHCVKPREEAYGSERVDAKGMPFASYYVLVDEKVVMFEGGYNTFPYAVSRYVTGPGEIYGRSPAMMALPAIKVLNEQKKTLLKQGHRVVDPVLLTHDDGVLDTFSLKPGSINAGGVNSSGQRLVHELPTGNIAAGQELMDMERNVINDAFLVSLFQILVETPTMTATEVLERAREKGALLSPTMGRQQSEMLGPMIEREVDLLVRQGLLPPMPDIMLEAEDDFEIVYDSPLTRSQRAEEAAGWLRTLEAAIAYANTTQDLSALDHFNTDVIYPAMAEINAVPASWMNSQETVAQKREERAASQQQEQMITAAPAAAGVMKQLGGL